MVLLIFHLVLSSFTFEGVDIHMAQKILDYQIERYPNGARFSLFLHISCTRLLPQYLSSRTTHAQNLCWHPLLNFMSDRDADGGTFAGVFFLFGQGRLHLTRAQPATALVYYQRALESQNQYRNLHHISFWEMAIANLALWDISASLARWRTLAAEASVGRALAPSARLRSDCGLGLMLVSAVAGVRTANSGRRRRTRMASPCVCFR